MPRKLTDLLHLFDSLPESDRSLEQTRFMARAVPDILSCNVGKDADGFPVLIIETDSATPKHSATPLLLENLSVLHNVDCRLQFPDLHIETRRATVIRCTDSERVLHEYFLRAMTPVMISLPKLPTQQQVGAALDTLVMLFSQTTKAPRKTIMGLWAELFVIADSLDPTELIRCWHALPEDRFDFANGSERIEVKAAAGRIRCHRFALEQLRPPGDALAFLASVLVERAGFGTTIVSLLEKIRQRVTDIELLIRLDLSVAQTLGSNWRHASTVSFDRKLAEESLRFFKMRDLPSIPVDLPTEISDVHFRVDLTAHEELILRDFKTFGKLINSASPVSSDHELDEA